MQQRYYDPAIGRLLSVDPAASEFNRYSYANNNPYAFTDPDGREPIIPRENKVSIDPGGGNLSKPTRKLVLLSEYGQRVHPVTGRETFHNGADLRARKGDEIMSTMPGKVEKIDSGGPGGNQIFVANEDGSLSGYAHTAPAPGIAEGVKVDSGQKLGKSDGSGRITGPHLHYTYRPGTTQEPATLETKTADPVKTQLKYYDMGVP